MRIREYGPRDSEPGGRRWGESIDLNEKRAGVRGEAPKLNKLNSSPYVHTKKDIRDDAYRLQRAAFGRSAHGPRETVNLHTKAHSSSITTTHVRCASQVPFGKCIQGGCFFFSPNPPLSLGWRSIGEHCKQAIDAQFATAWLLSVWRTASPKASFTRRDIARPHAIAIGIDECALMEPLLGSLIPRWM